MIRIAVSQRVDDVTTYNERRDALDRRWVEFLGCCGIVPVLIPNDPATARMLVESVGVSGVLLTGGNDLEAYGGNVPERDATEGFLLRYALERDIPVLGVCRGMQLIQDHFGVRLKTVAGHVGTLHDIDIDGVRLKVNSYHRLGSRDAGCELLVLASAEDGVIESVRHKHFPIRGIMWHPERTSPFASADIETAKSLFSKTRT